MNNDADHHESEVPEMLETQQETQEETQSTQPASQREGTMDAHLWGYLQPCNAALTRMDFWKIRPKYTIGRNHDGNEIILPGFKISNYHCVIMWDGKEDRTSCVTVQDLSSNGTFINGVKIGRGNTKILREGSELAFGTCTPQIVNGGIEDYRFVYRHLAAGPPTEGLYKYYDLCNELGKGSFATVMKAVHLATGEWVAIKMIQDKKANAAGTNANADGNGTTKHMAFMREISIMERLKHPNICELKEVYMQPNGDINLVLELVEGGDLLDYILTRHGLTEDDAKHITYQICDALSYIHSLGVAHRDLKPENILLTSDRPPRVKVADFGLAKVVDSLTMLRTMCGTPSYLAPEVVKQQNAEGYDNLVDSWSVGVIVFSMLTNAGPFIEDENQRDIRMRIIERQIDWDTLYNSNVSQEAQSFIRSLLVDNPDRRMTLTDALHHPWLQSYTPVYAPSSYLQQHSSTGSSIPSDDFSMLSDIPEGDEPGSSHNVVDIKREPSRSQPLQRRARVLEDAAEGKGEILQPSQEMINAVLLSEPENAVQKIDRKRALDEDAEMESAAEEDVVNNRKKGKNVFDDVASPRGKGRGRGKSNGGVSKPKAGAGRTKAIADLLQDVEMPYFNVHRSTTSETQSTDNKYYRFSKFQQSPPASALMELDISLDKVTVGEAKKNIASKPLGREMELPSHGRYKLQRGKPRRFRVPTKRTAVNKQPLEVYADPLKSLSLWVAYLLLSFVTSGASRAETYPGAVHEAGDLIYLEICRLKLSNCVVAASLWYARKTIFGQLEEVHDVPAVLHHLFLLGACLARKDTCEPPLTIETWTQCLGRNAVDFHALVDAAMVYMYPDFDIGSLQWQEWLHSLSQAAANHYPYDRSSQRAVQDVLERLVGC
ncbi:hypothetical protein EYR38_006258 [Pleurotus pulmonarius]|nr:hypothetical protein EYR38_006258 [Pleurotus pulmonarius]